MSEVVLFSTSTCPWRRRTKRYLKERRVPFKEVNIERDPDAARDIVCKTGQMGVPVIKIGGAWIVGFDKGRIDVGAERHTRKVGLHVGPALRPRLWRACGGEPAPIRQA